MHYIVQIAAIKSLRKLWSWHFFESDLDKVIPVLLKIFSVAEMCFSLLNNCKLRNHVLQFLLFDYQIKVFTWEFLVFDFDET